jgi:hypothetical protein
MRYGVIYFDGALQQRRTYRKDASFIQARDGWASVAGTEAVRFDKLTDLPSDVVWITNLDFTSHRSNELHHSPNFVPSYFLRTDIAQVAAEIGAHQDHERVSVIVQALSEVFARTMRLSERYFGAKEIPGNQNKKLENAIGGAIGRRTQPIDASLNTVMQQAHMTRCQVLGQPAPREWWQCTLRRNRYTHAYDVLDTAVPSTNNWEYLDASKLPASRRDRLAWAIDNPLPVVAKVRVSDGRGLEAMVTSFGGKKRGDQPREWVCGPELFWLSKYYNTVEIDAAYVCNDGYVLLEELARFPAANEFSLTSVSLGLLVENFLALMLEAYESPSKALIFYPHAVWYAAMDRFFMFLHAYQLVRASSYGQLNAGFRIVSYGMGNIQVAAPHEKIDELTDIAASVGLEVPSSAYWKRTMQYRMVQTEEDAR